MCRASRVAAPPAGARARCLGFTMIELSIAMFLIVGLTAILSASTVSSRKADEMLTAVGRVTERGQKTLYDVVNLVSTARRIFQGDDVGVAYLDALDRSRDPAAPDARLPLFDEEHSLGVDLPGDPRTGNMLLFVREADPLPCVADADRQTLRNVDTYRLICVYPRQTGRRLLVEGAPALDLVVWRSVRYASYSQLMAIEDDAQRASVVRDLNRRYGVDRAWDVAGTADASFYPIDGVGAVSQSPLQVPQILEDETLSDRGRLVYADVQLARTKPADPLRRALLTLDAPGAWAPDGFEVKVAGGASGRQVWIHLVVETRAGAGGGAAALPSTMIAYCQDF